MIQDINSIDNSCNEVDNDTGQEYNDYILPRCRQSYMTSIRSTIYCNVVDSDTCHQ